MNFKKIILIVFCALTTLFYAQSIQEVNYNVSGGTTTSYDNPGTILYPTGYSKSDYKTPVVFIHGITGTLSGSYTANIDQVRNYNLNAAFVQLKPLGSTIENGKLLKKMIDKIRWHYNAETVSIVAHSKGGMDTERALYGQNPYTNSNLPSFGYEKVDGVYTFSSPVRGARVADVGSTLSWFSGVVWATMWYTNGWSLTSGNVNSFHNWARGWRINSTSTFQNYYNQNGASYSRINMSEDNTTRWWAHQSNDECYEDVWYYCYIGRPFQHSVGAYIDAYWEWDWFNSGWRNWHSNSDGFISEYRAKRYANTNSSPSLTPGAGDTNYRTMRDANHSSLWESEENHFTREVAPYLHRGLYGTVRSTTEAQVENQKNKDEVKVQRSRMMASNGNMYFGKDGKTNFIVEESNNTIEFIIYSSSALDSFELINKVTNTSHIIEVLETRKDDFSGAFVTVANSNNLEKGTYDLKTKDNEFLVIANNKETSTAFALNLNFDEKTGYNGEFIEVGIANKDNAIDFNNVTVTATLTKVALNENTPIKMDKVINKDYTFIPTAKEGIYKIAFNDLTSGSVYSLRVKAIATTGEVLLSRNIVSTFYIKKDIEPMSISVITERKNNSKKVGFNTINVYPNPTSGMLTINNSKNSINSIEILNNQSQSLKTFNVNKSNFNINLRELGFKSGLYILKIQTTTETIIKKIMVK